jgi:polysaccharide deacetylase 2 family uncharacterized protein YibQ
MAELAGQWGRRLLYGVILPLTAIVVIAAGWYVATGETPSALFHRLTAPPSVVMALPPRAAPAAGQQPGDALLKPPPAAVAPSETPAKPGGAVLPSNPQAPPAPPPQPARGVIPAGPSPMKPTPLNKVAEMPPPPAPPAAPAAGAMPAAPAPPPAPAASAMPAAAAPSATVSSAPVSAAANGALTPMAPTAPPPAAPAANPPAAAIAANPPAAAPSAETSASKAAPAAPPPAAPAPPTPVAVAANAPPPPPMAEPLVPPGGEPLAPPSFAQLPARTDLKPLAAAPQPDLLRDSPDGPLPVIAGDRMARAAYARPFALPKDKPVKVAIAVVGLGLSRDAAEAAIAKLPPEVDLSFSPNAGNLDTWVKKARDAGHEVLLDLPLEPPNYPLRDTGPLSILSRDGPGAAVDRLDQILGKTTGYVGLAATLRSPVVNGGSWDAILKELKSRGLLLIGDAPVPAAAADVPALVNVALVPDQTPFRAAIDVELNRLLATAQRDGQAVGYVSPLPVTFERLLAWAATLPQKNAVLTPVSAVVKAQP